MEANFVRSDVENVLILGEGKLTLLLISVYFCERVTPKDTLSVTFSLRHVPKIWKLQRPLGSHNKEKNTISSSTGYSLMWYLLSRLFFEFVEVNSKCTSNAHWLRILFFARLERFTNTSVLRIYGVPVYKAETEIRTRRVYIIQSVKTPYLPFQKCSAKLGKIFCAFCNWIFSYCVYHLLGNFAKTQGSRF